MTGLSELSHLTLLAIHGPLTPAHWLHHRLSVHLTAAGGHREAQQGVSHTLSSRAPGPEAPTLHLALELELALGSTEAGTRQAGPTSDSQAFCPLIGPDRRGKSEQKLTNKITRTEVSLPCWFPVPLPIRSTRHTHDFKLALSRKPR